MGSAAAGARPGAQLLPDPSTTRQSLRGFLGKACLISGRIVLEQSLKSTKPAALLGDRLLRERRFATINGLEVDRNPTPDVGQQA